MTLVEFQACCGKKHGNSHFLSKRSVDGRRTCKSKSKLILELEQVYGKVSLSATKSSGQKTFGSMSFTELRACCGRKHGNSIALQRRTVHGKRTANLKSELLLESHAKVPSFGDKYDLMSLKELRACFGKLHGNSIGLMKRTAVGTQRLKTKSDLLLELKQVHSVLPLAEARSPRKLKPLTGGRLTRRAGEITVRRISELRAQKQK